ncbi:hypothetical protein Vafri_14702 [Volvox africanus]|uniref:Uncharacterized protein n=1 Tax=Volvox africanus TaxID=51714 RepID=A0A8J4BJ81_9CHLO|nr:hypothetical protein Vafri_14702 [Volvox africanus]
MFLTDSSLNHDTATATSCSIFCHTRFTSARMRSRTGAPPGDTTTCANVPPAVPRDKRPGLITTTGAALTAGAPAALLPDPGAAAATSKPGGPPAIHAAGCSTLAKGARSEGMSSTSGITGNCSWL